MPFTSTDRDNSIPPVVSKGYQAKGSYQTINGLKTCMWNLNLNLIQLSAIFSQR